MKNSRKVTYFANHGQAEAIRMLLHHAKVVFIDERLSKEEFTARKSDFPAGQLPCYTDDQGKIFNQSQAILRALGIEFGYYPTNDPWQAWACDWAMDTI